MLPHQWHRKLVKIREPVIKCQCNPQPGVISFVPRSKRDHLRADIFEPLHL
jgi:hypothetical protein